MHTNFKITDNRTIEYFKKTTFCGYKKTNVIDALKKNILLGNIEKASLWATELHISGYTRQLFDIILNIYLSDINTANIQLLPVIYYDYIKIQNIKTKQLLYLRNNQYSRNHIHNLISYVTFSPKSKLHKIPKIKPEDFNIHVMKKHMISSDRNTIDTYMSVYDPKEIVIPILEIYTNIIQKNNAKSLDNCLYWLAWLCTYEKKFHKGRLKCNYRINNRITEKEANDFIWIVWDILFDLLTNDNSTQKKIKQKYMKCLFNLYTKNYKYSQKTKKLPIIIMALSIIIDPHPHIHYTNHIIAEKKNITRIKILANINYQYIDIQNNTPKHLYAIVLEQHNQIKKKDKKKDLKDSIFSNNTPSIPINLDQVIANIDRQKGRIPYSEHKKKEKVIEKIPGKGTQTSLNKHIIHMPQQQSEQSIFNRRKKKYQTKHIHNFNTIFKYM